MLNEPVNGSFNIILKVVLLLGTKLGSEDGKGMTWFLAEMV